MKLGTECLVCINGSLLSGELLGIHTYNVIVEVFYDDLTEIQTVPKRNVIEFISPNSFELIKEVAALNKKERKHESR